MNIKKEKIKKWLDLTFAKLYFKIRRFYEHWIIRFFINLINKFYNLILSVSLLLLVISFIFFYIRHFLDISFNNIFLNFKDFLNNNIVIYLYLIVSVFLIWWKYILNIFKFLFKYFINWNIFWTLIFFTWIIATSSEKVFFDNINSKKYFGIFFWIIVVGLAFKYLFLLDKKDSKKWYYFDFYKKEYDKIHKNKNLENKIIDLNIIWKKLNKIYIDFKGNPFYYKIFWKVLYFLFGENSIILVSNLIEKYNIKNIKLEILEKHLEVLVHLKNIKNRDNNLLYELYLENIKNLNIKKNFIEPISDEPIWIWNDIFKNENFAKNIYDLMNWINFEKFEKSYSIWVVWEWWGWKSSIINLLDEQFLDWNPNFKVLRFNPWDYKKDKLINNFFWELSKILWVKNISNLFKNYLKLLWNIDSSVKIWLDFLSWFVWKKSLEEIRNEINSKLKEFDRKIVVVIDDLDRCEPDEVLMMLNLVKNLWDFNNIIYLVSYDKEHIIKVLENKRFSWDYIEKIINIERFIPVPNKEQLKKYFEDEFTKILKNLDFKIYTDDKLKIILPFISEWIFDNLFEKENLRFIKKLLNQLNVILQLNLWKEKSEISDLSKEDFKNIFIINYCKLKDYKLFNKIIQLKENILLKGKNKIFFNEKDIYNDLIYIDIFYNFKYLFYDMLWLNIGYKSETKEYYITDYTNTYKRRIDQWIKDDTLIKFELIKKTLNLLKEFS